MVAAAGAVHTAACASHPSVSARLRSSRHAVSARASPAAPRDSLALQRSNRAPLSRAFRQQVKQQSKRMTSTAGALQHHASAPRPSLSAALTSDGLSPRGASDYFATDARPIILFDGVCNMCNGGVNFVLSFDTGEGKTRFAALQSDAGRALLRRAGRAPNDISSIVLVERNRALIKSDAVLRIADTLETPFPELAAAARLVPSFIRDTIYDLVAANRYRIFGESSTCRLSDPKEAARFISSA